MSGHSKWATTKRQKGITDAKRGAAFTRLANVITIAAREGGDPNFNFKLKLAVALGKEADMPKENIERAIKKGTGELEGVKIEEITYEAFGPGGVALIIETVTDSRNRTVAELKNMLTNHGGSLGNSGSVAWMFEKRGIVRIHAEASDELEMKLIEMGAEDIAKEEEGIVVYTKVENLKKMRDDLEKAKIAIDSAEVGYVPKEKVKIEGDTSLCRQINALFEALDEDGDINNYYDNTEF